MAASRNSVHKNIEGNRWQRAAPLESNMHHKQVWPTVNRAPAPVELVHWSRTRMRTTWFRGSAIDWFPLSSNQGGWGAWSPTVGTYPPVPLFDLRYRHQSWLPVQQHRPPTATWLCGGLSARVSLPLPVRFIRAHLFIFLSFGDPFQVQALITCFIHTLTTWQREGFFQF